MGVSFDLFGTLVTADRPDDPADAVATELAKRDVTVPDDWAVAYAEPHVDAPEGAEVPLPAHVSRALASRGVDYEHNAARRAVVAAFDPTVETRPGALEAVDAARERGSIAICSNCSVPELVGRTLVRSDFERDDFDAIVTSVGCGWRKPAPEIFDQTADELGVATDDLVHVGDDPRTDGGIEAVGGTGLLLENLSLADVPSRLASLTADEHSSND
ncbi:HAD family hydrolase [Natrinema sp. SYSU A 869]|uniref:HAD family hydrolase n=1 Tax=Natrinema sp. SYSU A 869 TaxID=2871694 RepID=UPI001CA3E87B|nr:HAD family hydrolase [Natrinema sp. SYSU A 869]